MPQLGKIMREQGTRRLYRIVVRSELSDSYASAFERTAPEIRDALRQMDRFYAVHMRAPFALNVSLAPLLALWFGPGLLGKVLICALIVFFPVAISTMVGIRSVDARLLELGRSLRATRRQVLLTLEIPAAMPNIETSA